jgi:hypothetical protein
MKNLLNAITFSLLFSSCAAQQVGERIMQTSVVIYNNNNQKMTIVLGEPAIKMDTFILKGGEVWISPVYKKDPTIKIQTKSHVANYQLKLGNYYMIFWNGKKKYWDLKKTSKKK